MKKLPLPAMNNLLTPLAMKKMTNSLTMKNLPLAAMKKMLTLAISTVLVGITTNAATFEKATTLTNGRYILVINENGTQKIATPILSGSTYGTMPLIAAASAESASITADEAYALTITVSGSTLTIQDDDSNYYGMASGHHLTIFMLYDAENDGCSYTYAINPSTAAVTLTNLANPSCILCQTPSSKAGASWNNYLAPAQSPTTYNLPTLYRLTDNAAITEIPADSAAADPTDSADSSNRAPVTYYNLQGQRIPAPIPGLYLRLQGTKVEKVASR
jgi:hypothetical protein